MCCFDVAAGRSFAVSYLAYIKVDSMGILADIADHKHDEWTDAVNIVTRLPVPSYGVLQMESYWPLGMHK